VALGGNTGAIAAKLWEKEEQVVVDLSEAPRWAELSKIIVPNFSLFSPQLFFPLLSTTGTN
jgi:hypothetical protein